MPITVVELQPLRGRRLELVGGELVGPRARVRRAARGPPGLGHALLWACEGGTAIEDLASTNGLYVNGLRCTGIQRLSPGDVVHFGATVWVVLPR